MPTRLASLNNKDGTLYSRSKPQYEHISASEIVDVLGNSIVNDGTGDQTNAINNLLLAARGKVIFFPAGVYRVEGTIEVPEGSVIIGSAWSQIMAAGPYFGDAKNPKVVVKVGNEGDVGSVEITDMLFTVQGATSGAILMEWNIHEGLQGSAAMWDCHFRVGGAKGSDLQLKQCPAGSTVNDDCIAASMLFHMTPSSSGYFENVWMWTADHDLDSPGSLTAAQSQINVISARGALIESQGPTWFYGSAIEHNVLYQYELFGAKNIFLGHLQTETPYYQPTPAANDVFVNKVFDSDPTFTHCRSDDHQCNMAYALRIVDSSDIYIYGAGLYSFFSSYSEDCLTDESCQKTLLETNYAQAWIMNLFTKGSIEAASPLGDVSTIFQKDTQAGFTTELSIWSALGEDGHDIGDPSELANDNNDQEFDWSCPNADNYADLDAIAADNSIPVTCHNYYILAVMSKNLTASLDAYTELMNQHYEEKFKYYVKAIEATAPINWQKFYHNEYDDLVTCTWLHPESKSSNHYIESVDGCPPNKSPSYANRVDIPTSLTTSVNDMDAFLRVAEGTYGLQAEWIDFDASEVQEQYCTFQPPPGTLRSGPCPVGDATIWSQPELWSNISVTDPAKSITKSLDNYRGISEWLEDIVLEMSIGAHQGSDADVIDALDTVVYTVDSAVSAMQQVYDVGAEVEEKIKEEEHKNIILLFISAFLLLIPGLGEELDLIVDASIFARMGTLIGDAGEAATALYSVYEDPESAPLAIGGLLIGGLLSREDQVLGDAAKIRRGMSGEKIAALGVKTETNLKKLAPIRARCDI
ncbi:pectin lyase-like protein [Aureobasidium sp. EXF-10727]|nr:pectin lyase-like protein [Aureobasidium sp. EXF-10727]